jgi:hypothetical protein
MQRYPRFRQKNSLLGILFVAGLFLIALSTIFFDSTFISDLLLLAIAIGFGILITPFFKQFFNIYFLNPYNLGHIPIFLHAVYNSVSFGGTLVFLLLLSNEQWASPARKVVTTPVIAYGHDAKSKGSSCETPYVIIDYDGIEKKLPFGCGDSVEHSSAVRLELQKGLWGFEVIAAQALVSNHW